MTIGTLELQPGDCFACHGIKGNLLDDGINLVQSIWARDRQSEYTHAGIILNTAGETFEARFRIGKHSLWDYRGRKVLIARYVHMTPERFKKGMWPLSERNEDTLYPFWRLAMHILPPVARLNLIGSGVCSELTVKFIRNAGLMHKSYPGWNVDMLVDKWRRDRNVRIIYEEVL